MQPSHFIIVFNAAPFSLMHIYKSCVEWFETACLESRIKKYSVSITKECKNLLTLSWNRPLSVNTVYQKKTTNDKCNLI